MRWRASSSRTIFAAWLFAFLIDCASSSTSTEAGRRDDQRRAVEAATLLFGQQVREQLHGLAEAHVVGEDAAESGVGEELQPGKSVALVATQRRAESLGLACGFAWRVPPRELG